MRRNIQVERKSRFVLLVALPEGRSTEAVTAALGTTIVTLPEALKRTLTWDQGKEMAAHVHFTSQTGVPVFFCDPHSPWQRGSNENTNGLLRDYYPKGTDFTALTQADLDAVADELNTRPRQTLAWRTPAEVCTLKKQALPLPLETAVSNDAVGIRGRNASQHP